MHLFRSHFLLLSCIRTATQQPFSVLYPDRLSRVPRTAGGCRAGEEITNPTPTHEHYFLLPAGVLACVPFSLARMVSTFPFNSGLVGSAASRASALSRRRLSSALFRLR